MHESHESLGFGWTKVLAHQVDAHGSWQTPVPPHAQLASAFCQVLDPVGWSAEQQSRQALLLVSAAHAESAPLVLPELEPLLLPLPVSSLPLDDVEVSSEDDPASSPIPESPPRSLPTLVVPPQATSATAAIVAREVARAVGVGDIDPPGYRLEPQLAATRAARAPPGCARRNADASLAA